ncbi:MAG: hypothetical protein ACO1OK_03515 [Devosia sp.]
MKAVAHTALVFACLFLVSGYSAFAQGVVDYAGTKRIIADKTVMSYDRGHGTQVEFIAGNGKTYLLYPGNRAIVRGEWKLDRTSTPNVFNMCFRYPTNSYNPVTGTRGGRWECQVAGFYFASLAEIVPGDVLGLARQQNVPFVLSRNKTSLARLIQKVRR